jgi:hypothetical protein
MPFDWTAATTAGPSTSTLRVDPDQVLQLKAELQPIYDDVDIFMQNYGQSMVMQPLGADPSELRGRRCVQRELPSRYRRGARLSGCAQGRP